MDKGVTDYFEKQKSPQKEILQKLRKIFLKTFPKIKEEIKMGVPWYEGKYYLVGFKDHVNIGFCIGGLSEKEQGLFEGFNCLYIVLIAFAGCPIINSLT